MVLRVAASPQIIEGTISEPRAVQPYDRRFASYPLAPVDLLVACGSTIKLGGDGKIEITRLAAYPLLLLDTSYVFRRNFDAAFRLGGLECPLCCHGIGAAFSAAGPNKLIDWLAFADSLSFRLEFRSGQSWEASFFST